MREDIEEALQRIRDQVEDEDFEGSQCHTLALALCEWFGGEMTAILRHHVNAGGGILSTTYSHMVCSIDGETYDINGNQAAERWCARWPAELDAKGLGNEFERITVSAESMHDFLADFDAVPVDALLEQALVAALADEQPLLVANAI